MAINIKVDYVTTLPRVNEPRVLYNPKVTLKGDSDDTYAILFIDADKNTVVYRADTKSNTTIRGLRQWYTKWLIQVYNLTDNSLIYTNEFNLAGQTVFIKFYAFALGDNLAWVPYIEEFRKKHYCNVICSTFFNNLFEDGYPNIMFVAPNTRISNVYAQYYIGALKEGDDMYSPVVSTKVPLQKVATEILGLEFKEIKPLIGIESQSPTIDGKYVCISEHASSPDKEWKYEGGWQSVVDYLNNNGYKVVVISKEPTTLKNVIDKTGDIPLIDRIRDIENASLFIGVSSGLSWLSWALGTHVILISDVTPSWHEFSSNVTRLIYSDKSEVDYSPTIPTSVNDVLVSINNHLKFKPYNMIL
jgi:autotransporter strand-loop-strand O-heptosyltransferase